MLETKQKGIATELRCLVAFNELGLKTSIPYGENSRYDFIVDINNHLLRVQAKTASGIENEKGELAGIKFSCRSTRVSSQGNFQRQYTKDEIDYFCTYWDNICYVVPVEECSETKTLRFFYPSNGQKTMINLAKDYTIEKQWSKFLLEGESFNKIENNIFVKSQYKNKCAKCGQPISEKAKLCVSCAHLEDRVTERPNRQQLKNLIRTTPFTQIADFYGVTDNAIRKWCDAYKLPRRKIDINAISEEEWTMI